MKNYDVEALSRLKTQLDELLENIYEDPQKRLIVVERYIYHELHSAQINAGCTTNNESVTPALDFESIRLRCLFFACQELLPGMTRRFLFNPQDHIFHEELILYIQDRLLADQFRRIRQFDSRQNTRFKTYLYTVVNHLALDYLRKQSREAEFLQPHIDIYAPENQHLDQRIETSESPGISEQEQLAWIENLLQQKANTESDSLQQQLGERLNLSLQERLFLKAIYFGGLSAEEAGALPAIKLNKNQSNSLHRRLLERFAELFKSLGLYEELQQLVIETENLQSVDIGDLKIRIAIEQIILLLKQASTSQCQIEYQNQAVCGTIDLSFSLLRKRLFNQLLDIRNNAMVGESYLQALDDHQKNLKLKLLPGWQEIQPRYRKKIKSFFATQNAGTIV